MRGFPAAKSASLRIDRASDRRESASNKKSNCARRAFINVIHRAVIRRKSWTFFAGKSLIMVHEFEYCVLQTSLGHKLVWNILSLIDILYSLVTLEKSSIYKKKMIEEIVL